jgi:acyl-CoA-binding protein
MLASSKILYFNVRSFQVRKNSDVSASFKKALAAITSDKIPPKDVSPQTKLKMYGLYKQVEVGSCNTEKPGFFDPVGRAKHDSWSSLGAMAKEDAMKKYIELATEIFEGKIPDVGVESSNEPQIMQSATEVRPAKKVNVASVAFGKLEPTPTLAELKLECVAAEPSINGVQKFILNRPKRGNSFNMQMWEDVRAGFAAIESDAGTKVVIMSGAGGNFSTGMDLSVFAEMQKVGQKETCEGRRREGIMRFIQYLQDITASAETCSVPVIAAISGHCIGGGIDIITACDMRYCTKDASFSVKEIDLAIVSENVLKLILLSYV